MKIIDTFHQIKTCYPNGQFDMDCWRQYADTISCHLKDKCIDDANTYDFTNEIFQILNDVMENEEKLITAHNAFLDLTTGLSEKIQSILGTDLDVSIIFYLGLCNGAGWATKLEDKPVILLGVEKIIELSWCDKQAMSGLIYHELGHIWHFNTRKTKSFQKENPSLWQLYTEGIAMYVEQRLLDDWNFYHQDKNDWLHWCNENKELLYREYTKRVRNAESTQDFFGDWNNFHGKADVGYYLGCELVKTLAKDHSLTELANLDLTVVASSIDLGTTA